MGIQRRLLAEPELTYKKAFDLAHAMGAAERNLQDLKGPKVGVEKVYTVKESAAKKQIISCYRCGANHRAAECNYKDLACHTCGKQGHLARVCLSRFKRTQPSSSYSQKETHQIQSETVCKQESEEYTLFNVKALSHRPMQLIANINAAELPLEVDTGATLSLISKGTYERLWSKASAPTL